MWSVSIAWGVRRQVQRAGSRAKGNERLKAGGHEVGCLRDAETDKTLDGRNGGIKRAKR